MFRLVIGHTPAKCAQRQVVHRLRKYVLALVHWGLGRTLLVGALLSNFGDRIAFSDLDNFWMVEYEVKAV